MPIVCNGRTVCRLRSEELSLRFEDGHWKLIDEFVPSREELYMEFLDARDFSYYRQVLYDMQKDIKDLLESGVIEKAIEDLKNMLLASKKGNSSGSGNVSENNNDDDGSASEREKEMYKDGSDLETPSGTPLAKAV